jgi:hypothetical protein
MSAKLFPYGNSFDLRSQAPPKMSTTFIPFDSLNNSPQGPLGEVANGLRGLACQALDTFPDYFLPPPNPLFGAVREAGLDFWENTLCPPPSPNPQYAYAPGCAVEYNAVLDADILNPDGSFRITGSGVHPIGFNVVSVWYETEGEILTIVWRLANGNVDTKRLEPNLLPPTWTWRVNSISLARADGQPVQTPCTNPVDYDFPDIYPPVIYIPIGGNTYPVEINPVTYDIGGDTYFSPQFNTSLGPFEFSPTGVNISPVFLPQIIPTISPGDGGATPDQVDDIINNANTIQTTNLGDIINNTTTTQTQEITENVGADLQALADFIECLIERPNESISGQILATQTPGEVLPLPDGTFAVYIMLAAPPSAKTRIQAGSGTSPQLYYWGWYAIGQNGRFTTRQELHYQGQVARIDRYQDSILINPIYGNVARVVALIRSNACQFTPANSGSS